MNKRAAVLHRAATVLKHAPDKRAAVLLPYRGSTVQHSTHSAQDREGSGI